MLNKKSGKKKDCEVCEIKIKEKDIDERVVKHAKVMKISIGGKNLSKNIPFVPIHNVSFHYEESVVK